MMRKFNEISNTFTYTFSSALHYYIKKKLEGYLFYRSVSW